MCDPRAAPMQEFSSETLRFVTDVLSASWATSHLFDGSGGFIFLGNRGTPEEFHAAFHAKGMLEVDPLNWHQIHDSGRKIAGWENIGRYSERYGSFMRSFDVTDAAEMLFYDSQRPIGVISLIWTDGATSQLRQRAGVMESVRRYVEMNFRRVWRGTALARRHVLREDLGLTAREAQVVELLCDGKTNTDIAGMLEMSLSTVKCHLGHIFTKTGAVNRAGLVRKALESYQIQANARTGD